MTCRRLSIAGLLLLGLVALAGQAGAQPCLIFVHGKQTDTNTYTSYTAARNYWITGSTDFVRTATKGFLASRKKQSAPFSSAEADAKSGEELITWSVTTSPVRTGVPRGGRRGSR
jgi:hypothetical protein